MKKTLLFSFVAAMAAVSAAPSDALAINSCKPALVCITNGYADVPVGTWVFELNQYVDSYGYEACSYFVKWIDANFLANTANLFLDELVVPGFLDCDVNSTLAFRTLVFNSHDYGSFGFDKFGYKRPVTNMVLSETEVGILSGVITFATNFPYPILVKDP